jgi:choline dehydrogenase-like flavoprotein
MFDFVIVGGGSAGCVLAARLSEDGTRSVALVEAGHDFADFETAPPSVRLAAGGAAVLREGSAAFETESGSIDWGYTATGSEGGGEIEVPRGKLLGGSGAINGCIWLRGVPEDFAHWAELVGPEWSWEQMLPAYRATETDGGGERAHHGDAGPFPVYRWPRERWAATQAAFHTACIEAGYGATDDHNDPAAMGVGQMPMNIEGELRWGPNRAVMTTAVRSRPNLTIVAETRAVRLDFEGRRASGVIVTGPDGITTIEGGEVILASGAVGSPHLLLLSGIGPSAQLEEHGIDVRSDLPGVGEGVRDHPKTWITWRLKDDVPGEIGDPMLQLSARYTATDSDLRGDMMLYPNSIVPGAVEGTRDFRIEAVNNLQLSSGRLSLRSADPDVHPAIDLGLLSQPRDRERLVDAIERSLALAETSAMRDVVGDVVLPDVTDPTDRKQVAEYVEHTVMTGQHISSSCALGRPDAAMAVVGPDCRVRGIDGLRIVDGSIMPDSIRANTHTTILAMAELMAGRIIAGD